VRQKNDYYSGEPEGPMRIWAGESDQWPGLAMSRSIGDSVAHNHGAISEPDIVRPLYLRRTSRPRSLLTPFTFSLSLHTVQIEHALLPGDEFLVIASDGIWDVLPPAEALAETYKHLHKPKKAAKALVAKAREKWEEADSYIDDITAVCVKLEWV
jgi:serine/threonine protein phosphatase PrpC